MIELEIDMDRWAVRGLFLVCVLASVPTLTAQEPVPYVFEAGDLIVAAELNANFDALAKRLEQVGPPAYMSEEHATGELWVDGKPVYRRVVVGPDPAALAHGVNIDTLIQAYGSARIGAVAGTVTWYPLPYVHKDAVKLQLSLSVDATHVSVEGMNLPDIAEVRVVMEYTRGSDVP